jgi:hypothetical protein
MNTLPSKAQVQQTISIVKSRESTRPNPMAEMGFQPGGKVFVAQGSTVQPVRRLIVLVPNVDMDEVRVAREVWELASPQKLHVLLLSMCIGISEEYQIQRRLINLAALIRDPRITVEFQIEYGRNWLRGVRSVLDDGDVILCHEEQSVGLRHGSLVNRLSALQAPVWTLSGIHPSNLAPHSRWLSITIFWFVTIVLLAGFFYLQTQINTISDSLAKNVLFCLSILVELGSLYVWNMIIS